MTDTELLNWLEGQSNGDTWVARSSNTGRGHRLHNISKEDGEYFGLAEYLAPTAREALTKAIKLNRNTEYGVFGKQCPR